VSVFQTLGGVWDCDSQFTILSPPSFDGPQLWRSTSVCSSLYAKAPWHSPRKIDFKIDPNISPCAGPMSQNANVLTLPTFMSYLLAVASCWLTYLPPHGQLPHFYHFATQFSDLHLPRAQCLRKVNSDTSQNICELSHATHCNLFARHALILMVSLYSDPVQAFENVILTIYSETHLIISLESLPNYVNVLYTIWPFCNRIYSFDAVRGCSYCCTISYIWSSVSRRPPLVHLIRFSLPSLHLSGGSAIQWHQSTYTDKASPPLTGEPSPSYRRLDLSRGRRPPHNGVSTFRGGAVSYILTFCPAWGVGLSIL